MIKILTDSCCDLSLEYLSEHRDYLKLVGIPINVDGKEFIDDMGDSFSHDEFYSYLRKGIMPTTSQISPIEFYDIFKTNHENGDETIYIGFSSGLSGTNNNAVLAKNMIIEDFKDSKVHIIDSVSASIGLGVLLLYVIEMINNDKSYEEIVKWVEEYKLQCNHWFAVTDLDYLKKGGRIPPALAAVGSLLNIKPILTMDNDGKLKSYSKVRGRKKSLKYLVDKLQSALDLNKGNKVLLGHGNCPEDAEVLKNMIMENNSNVEITVTELSATIATHVGPDMIAIAFLGEDRV